MKATTLIVDLLRTYSDQGIDVKTIMETGKLFSYSENQIRVSISRLVTKGTIEKIKRGYYRLSADSNPINKFADLWRLGSARCRPWENKLWICFHTPTTLTIRSQWVFNSNGFRQITPKLWIRPDNLWISDQAYCDFLRQMGIQEDAIYLSASKIEVNIAESWFANFDTPSLNKVYIEMNNKLHVSLKDLPTMTLEEAKCESFYLGGAAIALLAKDPLIPAENHDPTLRNQLHRTLMHYDEHGRRIWGHAKPTQPLASPTLGIRPELQA